jgi:GT2 family glycosyltransferase
MSAPARPIASDLSVVVPTLGGPTLRGCLDSLADGRTWPARLVVVDQSRDGSAALWLAALRARGLDVVHVRAEPDGISAATNRGLDRVQTRYAAVTHDDCHVRADWVERVAGRLADVGDQAIVTGRVEPEGEGIVLTIKVSGEPAIYERPILDGDVLFPPNMAFALSVVDRIGRLDEHRSLATAGEDNEWAHRALRAGVRIIYDPTLVVGHLALHRREDLPGLYRRYARGQGAFYGTWLRRGDAFILARTARDLLRAPWLLVRGLATRNPDLTAMGRGEIAGLVPGILAGLRNPGVRVARSQASRGRQPA